MSNNKRMQTLLSGALLGAVLVTPPAWSQTPAAGDGSYQQLLDQAAFWRENRRPDLAAETLQRVLSAEPDHPEALYRLALLELERDPAAARRYADRLREAAPNSDYRQRLEDRLRRDELDSDLLREARELARAGDLNASVDRYQAVFAGEPPPTDLALEYYQTLAGVEGRWQEAYEGLAELAERRPQDRRIPLALGEVMTYNPGTRLQGIQRLRGLWEQQPEDSVAVAWRQAVLWLADNPSSVDTLEAYLARFPDDQTVVAKLRAAEDGGEVARSRGYTALNAGRTSQAERAFRDALEEDPEDADALGGLGLVHLRAGRFASAEQALGRAVQLAPERAGDWRDALTSARFYRRLGAVRDTLDAGRADEAFQAVRPLTDAPGNRGRDARLLQGDILLVQGRAEVAEQLYRDLLAEQPDSTTARGGLVRALLAQGRYQDADEAFQQLPPPAREQLAYVRQQQAAALRDRGESLIEAGRPGAGESALREAMAVAPEDPWTRLSLARFYDDQNQPRRARALIEPLTVEDAGPESLEAAAMLAEKQARWDDALALLDRMPADARDAAFDAQRLRLLGGARVANLEQVLVDGDAWQVENALDDLYRNPPSSSQELGSVASLLVEYGEEGLALALVRRDLDLNLNEDDKVTPYLAHVSVLSRTGNEREARRLMAVLDRRASGDQEARTALDDVRNDLLLKQVAELRKEERYAEAYDRLVAALEERPQDSRLLLELGSLYRDGERYDDAAEVYGWLLEREPASVPARRGAVAAALAAGDEDRAEALLREAAPLRDSELLILAARTAEAQGDKRQALTFTEQAAQVERGAGGGLAGVVNPFRDSGARDSDRWASFGGGDEEDAGVWLPGRTQAQGRWQPEGDQRRYVSRAYDAAPAPAPAGSPYQGGGNDDWRGDWQRPGAPAAGAAPSKAPSPASSERLARIDALGDDLRRDLSPQARGGLALRFRDGESGLSELTELRADLGLSSVPFGGGRFQATVSPVFLNAGTIGADAQRRFGRAGPASDAAGRVVEQLGQVDALIDQVDQTASALQQAQDALAAAPADATAAELARLQANVDNAQDSFESANQRNVLFESGIDLDRLSADQRQFVDAYLQREFGSSDFSLEASNVADYEVRSQQVRDLVSAVSARTSAYQRAAASGNQTESGLGVAFGYTEGSFSADIGGTPFGFEVTNLVGGLTWAPEIADYTRLRLTAQRRAVTDSLLSYAGVEDPATGDRWGGVTRSGAEIGLSFDDGDVGTYGDLGFYSYQGHNVDTNQSAVMNAGAYLRPINEASRSLQTGVHLNYTSFDENRGQFTYGHGGYFSPQDYVSLAFPITYQERVDKLTWNARVSPGFQSYSVEDAAYFPTLDAEQQWLDVLAEAGVLPASRYEADSQSGFGLALGAGLDYQLSRAFNLGTQLGYDTFGDFSETSIMINLLYTMEP